MVLLMGWNLFFHYPDLQLNVLVDKNHFADTKSWYYGMELFNKTAQEKAVNNFVAFVNQQKAFKVKPELFLSHDTVHMTTEGMKLKTRLFLDKIVEMLLFEQPDNGQQTRSDKIDAVMVNNTGEIFNCFITV